MRVFIIRQTAVVPSDYSEPKEWREVIFFKWAKDYFGKAELWISDFDHYSLKKRKKVDFEGSEGVITFKTPGYRKTVSVSRLFDAWVFGIKIFAAALNRFNKKDTVIVNLPTPESFFAISIAKFFKGFKLIVDVRDNWPDSFPGEGIIKFFFSLYVHALNKISFSIVDKVIWMSDGLYNNHKNKNLLTKKNLEHRTIPNAFKKVDVTNQSYQINNNIFDKPAISFFGTLNTQFDLSLLKECLDSDPKSEEFNYIIAGDGSELQYLKELFKENKNVIFLGRIPYDCVQTIAKKSKGLFLLYRDPENFLNHITNKVREYAEFRKPIIHNLESNIFTISKNKYQIGYSLHNGNFSEAISEIKYNKNPAIYNIESLDNFCRNLSDDVLKKIFLDEIIT